MPATEPDLTIVTVSHDHGEELRAGLPTWLDAADRCVRELIVVDNTRSDAVVEEVRRNAPHATILRNERPRGFAENCNQGIQRARGRYVVLLNPDVRCRPGSLDALVAFMDARPDVGIAGPRLLNPDGSIQYSCRRFSTPFLFTLRGLGLERMLTHYGAQRRTLMQDWAHDAELDVDWVLGAAMIVRPEAVREVGLLDPGYYLYCEDQDWCYRMWAHGWGVYYVPGATMNHVHQRASAVSLFSRWKWIHMWSKLRLFRKQGWSGRRPAPQGRPVAARS